GVGEKVGLLDHPGDLRVLDRRGEIACAYRGEAIDLVDDDESGPPALRRTLGPTEHAELDRHVVTQRGDAAIALHHCPRSSAPDIAPPDPLGARFGPSFSPPTARCGGFPRRNEACSFVSRCAKQLEFVRRNAPGTGVMNSMSKPTAVKMPIPFIDLQAQ